MAAERKSKTGEEMKADVLQKISQFSEPNRPYAERIHEVIMQAAPTLVPRLWYGMPGYAKTKDSAVLLFFREDDYMTFGLTEAASFKAEQHMSTQLMPCAWFFTTLDEPTEHHIADIVKQAV